MIQRLKGSLPSRWFADETPVLDILLGGLATVWCQLHDLQQFLSRQTRLGTAEGVWLDLISEDFLGVPMARRKREDDDSFRLRIRREILRERGTRTALRDILVEATGREPIIFEPVNARDCGACGDINTQIARGLAYGAAGGWGSMGYPFQVFVTAFRPALPGIAKVPGWSTAGGGFSVPSSVLLDSMAYGQATTDAEIYAAIVRVISAGTVAWTKIQD
jgi:hypothetical protein